MYLKIFFTQLSIIIYDYITYILFCQLKLKETYKYKASYPELNELLKRSKEVVDYEVENALYKSAMNGNVSAMIFWLKNRKPSQWRDRREHSELELMKKELELRERKLKLEEQKLEDLKNKILNIDINIVD